MSETPQSWRPVRCPRPPDGSTVFDTLRAQAQELVDGRDPGRHLTPAAREADVDRVMRAGGVWFHYPWSNRTVHVLPYVEFREVRTDRNRYKITPAEQARLGRARIGVVGLSVGHAAALTLAAEGVGGGFRLADFDALSLSNLNRIRAGVHELGINKAVLAARAIAELDPYVEVEVVPEGLGEENLAAFLDGLDLLVEECDDIGMKLRVREAARARGIPVVMETSERGMVDVERFDLEPNRPILHGLAAGLDSSNMSGLTTEEKIPHVLRILGEDQLTARTIASMPEVRASLSTWPQLASAVALGGAVATEAARRILLGETMDSGRYYLDVQRTFEGPGLHRNPVTLLPGAHPASASRSVTETDPLRNIVAHAILAPSAHNAQPWRFRWTGEILEIRLDPVRSDTFLDYRATASLLALGAATENAVLAAGRQGLSTEVIPLPDGADLRFFPPSPPEDSLAEWMATRVTDRRRGTDAPLSPAEVAALTSAAEARILIRTADLDRVAALVGEADRLALLHPRAHREAYAGFRWTSEDALATRDGLDVATLGLTDAERAGMRLLRNEEAIAILASVGGGRALTEMARKFIDRSIGVGVVAMTGPHAPFRGGRAVQRMWLTATRLGLGLHPMTTLPYLLARHGEGLDAATAAALDAMRPEWEALFPPKDAIFLFRIVRGGPPERRSLRRSVDEVLQIPCPRISQTPP